MGHIPSISVSGSRWRTLYFVFNPKRIVIGLIMWWLIACQPSMKIENPHSDLLYFQYPDPEKRQSIQTIQKLPDDMWQEVKSPNFGREGGYGWAKFTLRLPNDQFLWLEVPSHFTDSMTVFVAEQGKPPHIVLPGTFNDIASRPFNHRHFVFPLNLISNKSYIIILRGAGRAPDVLKIPIRVWSPNEFIKNNQKDIAGWALFVGFMLMTFILALLGAIFFTNASLYLYFAFYILFLTLYALSNDGWVGPAPYPINLLDDNITQLHWLNLGLFFFILFSRRFLAVIPSTTCRRAIPWVILIGGEFAILLTQAGQYYQYSALYTFGFYSLGYILLLYFPAWTGYVINAVQRKFKPVWIHLISVAFLISFFITGSLFVNSGLLKNNWSNMFLLRWAMVTDVVIILFSWMYRNKLLEKERELLEAEQQHHKQLAIEATLRQKEEEIRGLHLQNEIHQQRLRLARDLHDGIGSELTHIINRLDVLSLRTEINQPLESLSDFTRATNQNLRDTLWVLNQKSISTQEWYDRTLQWLLKRWEDLHLPELITSFEGPSTLVLNPTMSISLFRITQEATNNTLKYANASQFDFIFQEGEACIELTIRDNGCGFDKVSVSTGYGLANMESRVQELSGKLSIESSLRNGTRIFLTIPIQKD